jgi:hypothetical protein
LINAGTADGTFQWSSAASAAAIRVQALSPSSCLLQPSQSCSILLDLAANLSSAPASAWQLQLSLQVLPGPSPQQALQAACWSPLGKQLQLQTTQLSFPVLPVTRAPAVTATSVPLSSALPTASILTTQAVSVPLSPTQSIQPTASLPLSSLPLSSSESDAADTRQPAAGFLGSPGGIAVLTVTSVLGLGLLSTVATVICLLKRRSQRSEAGPPYVLQL